MTLGFQVLLHQYHQLLVVACRTWPLSTRSFASTVTQPSLLSYLSNDLLVLLRFSVLFLRLIMPTFTNLNFVLMFYRVLQPVVF